MVDNLQIPTPNGLGVRFFIRSGHFQEKRQAEKLAKASKKYAEHAEKLQAKVR